MREKTRLMRAKAENTGEVAFQGVLQTNRSLSRIEQNESSSFAKGSVCRLTDQEFLDTLWWEGSIYLSLRIRTVMFLISDKGMHL